MSNVDGENDPIPLILFVSTFQLELFIFITYFFTVFPLTSCVFSFL